MDLEQALGQVRKALEEITRQQEESPDLFRFHALRGASAAYQAALDLLEPMKGMAGRELHLQRLYIEGVADALERATGLLRQIGEG